MNHPFNISFIDHVAIRVKDLTDSEEWYQKTLGFKSLKLREWGDFPVMMTSGNFGVALFSAGDNESEVRTSSNIRIDHFAFRVSINDLKQAIDFFQREHISFKYQHHHYFESIYLNDPDGHVVELTCPAESPLV